MEQCSGYIWSWCNDNDHVRMVWFRPGFATGSHCLFRGIVKPSFKTTGSYSTIVALSKISSYILGTQCSCKAGAGGRCIYVAALLYNILDYVELRLAITAENKTCTNTTQQWSRPRNIPGDGPILFSKMQCTNVHIENVRQRLQLLD